MTTVYAVMRGTEMYDLCETESLATRRAEKYNASHPRGRRFTAVPMTVEKEKPAKAND